MAITSFNIVFTRQADSRRPLVRPRQFEEADPGGQTCEPNRVVAAPLGLKVLGFVNTRDVIRNWRKKLNANSREESNIKSIYALKVKDHKINLILLFSSIIVGLYMIFFLAPYAENHGFISENEIPQSKEVIEYLSLSIPVIPTYLVFASIYIRKITFLKILIFPLFILNLYIGLCLCVIVIGGAILWIMIPIIIVPLIAIPVSFLWGLRQEIRYFNNFNE